MILKGIYILISKRISFTNSSIYFPNEGISLHVESLSIFLLSSAPYGFLPHSKSLLQSHPYASQNNSFSFTFHALVAERPIYTNLASAFLFFVFNSWFCNTSVDSILLLRLHICLFRCTEAERKGAKGNWESTKIKAYV